MFEQRATLTRQLLRRHENENYLSKHYEVRAQEADTHARTLRGLLLAGAVAREPDLQEN
jgi:hypothetical protein